MYLIELVVKLFNHKKKEKIINFETPPEDTSEELCEHVFLPIDSSGEILACSKCGMIVEKKNLKDINIFKRK